MNDQARVDELLDRWEEHWELGEEIAIEELCREAPDLAEEVRFQVRALKGTNWLFEPDDEECDFLTLPPLETMVHADTISIPTSVSLDEFASGIASSGLMTVEQLRQLRGQCDASNAQDFARKLIREQKLTPYQAKAVVDGNTKGLVLGNYVILDKIGAGGMGQVFLAKHRIMKRIAALKILPEAAIESDNAVERFHREVEAAARLTHPNIVTTYDADQANGVHFFVMEYVEGDDLSAVVRKRGRLSVTRALDCIIQVARGLEYAHKQGVIHRDIKPGNLLLDPQGTVKILDMGLARLQSTSEIDRYAPTQAELTQDGSVFGTVDYMSPEQALNSKDVDARADIYSLGCSLYYLLTGQAVYHGDSLMAKMLAHRENEIPVLHEERDAVPERLSEIFAKMVAKKAEDRYPTMSALLADLEALATEVVEDDEPEAAMSDAMKVSASSVDLRAKETSSASIGDTVDYYTGQIAQKPTKPETSSDGMPHRQRAWFAGGGVAAVALAILGYLYVAGVIFKIETPDGVIQIETNVNDVDVFVDNEKVVYITDPKDKTKIKVKIPQGGKLLRVSKAGFEADVREFKLNTVNGPIKVSLLPREVTPRESTVDREVAELVLKNGGEVSISASPKEPNWIRDEEDLPSGEIRLTMIHYWEPDEADLVLVPKLSSLRSLSISSVNVNKNSGPSHIAELRFLTALDLKSVTNDQLVHIAKLTNLSTLALGGPNVTDDGLVHLQGLDELEVLHLIDTGVTGSGLAFLSELKHLRLLYMTRSKMTDEGLMQLRGLNLEYLDLAETLITDAGMVHIRALPQLYELAISRTRITNQGLSHLADSSVSSLELTGCTAISDEGIANLEGRQLTRLILDDTKITDRALKSIQGMTNLKYLSLLGTTITDDGLKQLSAYPNPIKTLRLSNTNVTPTGVATLQKALPNCKIEYESLTSDDPDRQVAEMVLNNGGKVGISGQEEIRIEHAKDLPSGEIRLTHVYYWHPTDADLLPLSELSSLEYLMMGLEQAHDPDGGLSHIADLKSLTYLSLGDVTDAGMVHLSKLTNLEELALHGPTITDDGLAHLQSLNNLDVLYLRGTGVTGRGLAYLSELKELRRLFMDGSELTDEGLKHLRGLNLEYLDLRDTQITDAGTVYLKDLPQLKMLVVDRTQISNDGLRHLVDSSVTELDLTSCPAITDEGIAYLEGRQFKRLGLAGTKITDNALKSVQGMTSLGHLDVSGTAITNDGLRFLEPLTHLRYLLLNETDISDDGLRYLEPLKSLYTLSLKRSKVTATGIATLQKALPECKIDYGPLVTDDPDRDVAEQIIGIEGTLFVILEDGTKTTIQGAEALAKVGRFAIYNVSMPYNSAVNDDLLRQLANIETLSVLDIPGTKITDDGIAALQGSLKIGVLRLDDTAVTDEAMATVGTWKRLRELRLSGTKVTDIGIRHLADLPELYLLYLGGTAVTDKGLQSLKSIRSLEQLYLTGTVVSGEGLRDLDQITWLDLAQTRITDADVKKIKGLRLERLNLGATKITGEALRDLAEMKSLRNLEISNCGNRIGDTDLVRLRSLADLSVLDLRGTNVTAAAVAELQGSLPDCKIAYSSP